MNKDEDCTFCNLQKEGEIYKVFEDDISLGFLAIPPLFHGHCLLIPKEHYRTLIDLSTDLINPLFLNTQLLAKAVEIGLNADGSFIAINNKISQSVPHLHIHIVPRRKKDGLRGFFWPRHPYKNKEDIINIRDIISSAVEKVKK